MGTVHQLANFRDRMLGAMFPGYFPTQKHNHYIDFSYPAEVTFDLAYAMFNRNGIARAGIDKTIGKTWQDNPFLLEKERDGSQKAGSDETTLERDIRQRFDDLRLWQRLAEADRRSLVGRYSAVILRLADNKRFSEPVRTVPGGLMGLVEVIPVWEGQLTVAEWDTLETSDTYGQPKLYQFSEAKVGNAKENGQARELKIHPDRVLIWSKDGSTGGRSFLEPGYNDLLTMEKISGAGGEGFWKNAKSAPVFEVDKDAKLSEMARAMGVSVDDVADKMDEQVRDWQAGFDQLLMIQGMQAKTLGITLPSPEHFFSIALQAFAASISCPLKILVGNQTGERASTEDAADWAQTNMGRRTGHVIPNAMSLVRRLQRFTILPKKDWHLDWSDLTEASMGEKIDRADKMAGVNQKMKDSGELIFTPEEIREVVDLEPLSDAEKFRDDLDDEADALADEPALNSGGGRAAERPFVGSAKGKHKPGAGLPRKSFDPSQPRGGDGRWVDTGARLKEAAGLAGQNVVHHVPFAAVKTPAALSKLLGVDVRGFKHSASNQAMRHVLEKHGNPAIELARGQKAVTEADFLRLPQIVKAAGPIRRAKWAGPPRIQFSATVGEDRYEYVGEVRRKQRRIDMITMWKK